MRRVNHHPFILYYNAIETISLHIFTHFFDVSTSFTDDIFMKLLKYGNRYRVAAFNLGKTNKQKNTQVIFDI